MIWYIPQTEWPLFHRLSWLHCCQWTDDSCKSPSDDIPSDLCSIRHSVQNLHSAWRNICLGYRNRLCILDVHAGLPRRHEPCSCICIWVLAVAVKTEKGWVSHVRCQGVWLILLRYLYIKKTRWRFSCKREALEVFEIGLEPRTMQWINDYLYSGWEWYPVRNELVSGILSYMVREVHVYGQLVTKLTQYVRHATNHLMVPRVGVDRFVSRIASCPRIRSFYFLKYRTMGEELRRGGYWTIYRRDLHNVLHFTINATN